MKLDKDTRSHLKLCWRGGKYSNFWHLMRATPNEEEKKYTQWFGNDNRSIIPDPTNYGPGWDIYFGLYPTTEKKGPHNRTSNEIVSAVGCLFADCDIKDGWTEEKVKSLQPAPSLIVATGGGWQVYWFLSQPEIITDDNRAKIQGIIKRWVKYIGADPGAALLAQNARLPGSQNCKYDPPRLVEVLQPDNGARYSLDELVGMIPAEEKTPQKREITGDVTPADDLAKSAENLLASHLRRIEEIGGRNKTGFSLACQLRDLGLSKATAESYLLRFRSQTPKKDHEYTEKDMLDSLDQAYKGTRRDPPQSANYTPFGGMVDDLTPPQNVPTGDLAGIEDPTQPNEPPEAPPPPEGTTAKRGAHKTRWSIAELYDVELPPVRWFVQDVIPAGMIFLGGRPKVGKSWLALQLAVAVATGGRFLGKPVNQGKVLYLALEDSENRLKDRSTKMQIPRGAELEFEQTWKPLHQGGLDDLLIEIERNTPQLVIVDTFLRVTRGLPDEADKVSPITHQLQRIAIEKQICILIVDHTRKPNGLYADPIDDLIGSTAKAADADSVMVLYKQQGKAGALLKARGKEIGETEIPLTFDVNTWSWQPDDPDIELTDRRAEILSTLEDIGSATAQKVATLLNQDYSNTRKRLQDLALACKVKIQHLDGKTYYEKI